jgi:hypothetical protein
LRSPIGFLALARRRMQRRFDHDEFSDVLRGQQARQAAAAENRQRPAAAFAKAN